MTTNQETTDAAVIRKDFDQEYFMICDHVTYSVRLHHDSIYIRLHNPGEPIGLAVESIKIPRAFFDKINKLLEK